MRESSGAVGRIAILLVLFVILPFFFTALYFAGNLYSIAEIFEPYNLSIIFGAVVYVLFMGQFLLASRLRFLERFIPQDRLISVHSVSGIVISVFILIHFVLKWILVFSSYGLTIQGALGLAAILIYAVLTPLAVFVLRGRGKRRKNSPPYEKMKAFHNLFAVAGILAAIHVVVASSTWSALLRIFAVGWGGLCLSTYVYHKIIRPRKRLKLILEETIELTPDIHRYRFSGDLTPILQNRKAGQFGYWSFMTNPEEHPFTISTPPGENLEITVRSGGDFTKALPDVPIGTEVLLDGPYGGFRPRGLPEGTPLLFFAGGIGIAPFLSIVGDENIRRKHPIALLWSVRNSAEEAAGERLFKLAERNLFFLKTVRSRMTSQGSSEHITVVKVREALDSLRVGEGKSTTGYPAVFICGPSGFSGAMRQILREIGIPKRYITEERFFL